MEQLTTLLPTTDRVESVEPAPDEDLTTQCKTFFLTSGKNVSAPRADILPACLQPHSPEECDSFEGGEMENDIKMVNVYEAGDITMNVSDNMRKYEDIQICEKNSIV